MESFLLRIVLGILEIVLIAWTVNRFTNWHRSHSSSARERAIYKQRLPNWIKSFEYYSLALLFPSGFLGLFFASIGLHNLLHPDTVRQITNAATALLMIPDFFFAMMLAMLSINLIEWLVPPMKRANDKAAEGLPAASIRQLTTDLLKVLEWVGPFCLILWLVGFALK
jgi:hypothetical protein